MKFVVVILVVMLRKHVVPSLPGLVRDLLNAWWSVFRDRDQQAQAGHWWYLAGYVGLPAVLLALLLGASHAIWHAVFYWVLVLGLALLVLGIDTLNDIKEDIAERWTQGNLAVPEEDEIQQPLLSAADMAQHHFDQLANEFAYSHLRHRLAPLFWFVLLGPVAMVGYWLLVIAGEDRANGALRQRAHQLLSYADWLPVRALSLSMALMGDFVATFESLRSRLLQSGFADAELLSMGVTEALRWRPFGEGTLEDIESEGLRRLDEMHGLLHRCRIFWIVILALLTVYYPLR